MKAGTRAVLAAFLILMAFLSFFVLDDMNVIEPETATAESQLVPGGETWSFWGSHSNTETNAQGQLVVDLSDPDYPEEGTYVSDIHPTDADRIEIDRMNIDAENMRYTGNNQRRGTIQIILYDGSTPVETTDEFQINNGLNTVPIGGLVDADDYDGYQFSIELYTEDNSGDTSPKINSVETDYTSFSRAEAIPFDISHIVFLVLVLTAIGFLVFG